MAKPPTAVQIEAALGQLRRAGLVCGRSSSAPLHILGGTSVSRASGIEVFHAPFSISAQSPAGFTALVVGVRPFWDEEARVDALDEAVREVLRIYEAREALPALDGRR